ncbi:WGR domain-containing protein [Agrobacterium vitis]|uniref:WGR domain-containing protein n=1 Tax=Agrobacterium vitis TaxID=373 RepID=UPI003D2A4324
MVSRAQQQAAALPYDSRLTAPFQALFTGVNRSAAKDSKLWLDIKPLRPDRRPMMHSLKSPPLPQLNSILPDALYLMRIDADRHMARYYALTIEPNLFGELTLVRRWGRIGSSGQQKSHTVSGAGEGASLMARFCQAKIRRGYCAIPQIRVDLR